MDAKKENSVDKNPDISIRQKIIVDLVRSGKNILSIPELIREIKDVLNKRYPGKYPNADFQQPLISKDFRQLGIKSNGRNKGFRFTDEALAKYTADEIKTVFEFAKVAENDIVKAMYPLIIKVSGYSQAISLILKKMYTPAIIETICLESSLIVFCDTYKNREIINNHIISIVNSISTNN